MFNFLALLGWSPGGNDEVFSRQELTDRFALDGISGGNAVFNTEKLEWFNQQHIVRLAPEEVRLRIRPLLESADLWSDEYLDRRHAWLFAVIELLKPRAKRLDDFVEQGRFLFADTVEFDTAAVEKYLRLSGMHEHLAALDRALMSLETFDALSIEQAIRATADSRGVKAAMLIHAMRVTVTGKSVSPGLFDVLALLGRDRVHPRILRAIGLLDRPTS